MKVTDQTVSEFLRLCNLLQLVEQPLHSLKSGSTQEARDGIVKVLAELESAEKSFADSEVKETASMFAQVCRSQLDSLSNPFESEPGQQKKLVEVKKLHANFESKFLAVKLAIHAHQNPSLTNGLTSWLARLLDKFRV